LLHSVKGNLAATALKTASTTPSVHVRRVTPNDPKSITPQCGTFRAKHRYDHEHERFNRFDGSVVPRRWSSRTGHLVTPRTSLRALIEGRAKHDFVSGDASRKLGKTGEKRHFGRMSLVQRMTESAARSRASVDCLGSWVAGRGQRVGRYARRDVRAGRTLGLTRGIDMVQRAACGFDARAEGSIRKGTGPLKKNLKIFAFSSCNGFVIAPRRRELKAHRALAIVAEVAARHRVQRRASAHRSTRADRFARRRRVRESS